jgi:hypothetical protein
VAVASALSVAFMVGAVALAVDLSAAYNLSTSLDNAADSYAIAGATQLDGSTGSCWRAIRAATAEANGGVGALRNVETFASNTPNGIVTIDDVVLDPGTGSAQGNANIRFLSEIVKDSNGNITGTYITGTLADCDTTANFIEVTVDSDSSDQPYRIGFALAPILGVTEARPVGYAVAGLGNAFCGAAPMMMCELSPLPGGATSFWTDLNDNPEVYRGRGLWLRAGDNNNQWGSGNFGFLQVEGACGNQGADCLEDSFAVNPELVCLGLEGLETETGANSGARDGFNTMFDIYPTSGISSSDSQWQPAANTVKGEIHTGTGPTCTENEWGTTGTVQFTGPTSIAIPAPANAAMPYPMDDCAYENVACPAASCGGTGACLATDATNRMGTHSLDAVGGVTTYWDLATYLEVNQDGMTENELRTTNTSFMTANPLLGATDPITRYMIYEWEMGYPGTNWGSVGPQDIYLVDSEGASKAPTLEINLPHPFGSGSDPAVNDPEYGGPHCYSGPMGDVGSSTILKSDRRVIQIAVVDCVANVIQGNTKDVTAKGFVEVLVITPWTVQGGEHDIYVEIIGPVADNGVAKSIAKNIVQLYE